MEELIKMKLNELVVLRPTLEKIAGKEMDGAVALKFAKFVRDVLMEIQGFEVKRAELFNKLGEVSGEGEEKKVQILPANEKKFNVAIKKALDAEVKVKPFDIASLGIKVSPAELINSTGLFK